MVKRSQKNQEIFIRLKSGNPMYSPPSMFIKNIGNLVNIDKS